MATGYSAGKMVAHNMVTTQFELDGFRVTRTLGVVRGIVVRSRSIFGTIGAGLQTLTLLFSPTSAKRRARKPLT